jgi:hypothetical protein
MRYLSYISVTADVAMPFLREPWELAVWSPATARALYDAHWPQELSRHYDKCITMQKF